MVAYFLCAGFGTRMRPLTDEIPKSLLRVGGRPLLDHLMAPLRDWRALDAVHLVVNRQESTDFRRWAEEVQRPALETEGVSLHVHDNGVCIPDEQRGAVGDLAFLLEQTGVPDNGALVSGGDSLYRFPLAPVLNAFDGTRSQVLALYEPDRRQRRQSSTLLLDGPRVEGLAEESDADSTRICPSWYLLTSEALDEVRPYLRDDGDPDTLGAFIHALVQTQPIEAIRLPERPHLRLHCNTPDDLRSAREILENEPRHLIGPEAVRRGLPDCEV